MIEFQGTFFDGRSSAARAVTVSCDGAEVVVRGEAGEVLLAAPLAACRLSEPLGCTARTLRLPGNALCEVADAAGAAELARWLGAGRGMGFVHALEARWRAAAAGLAVLALCAGALIRWGIPAAAKGAAAALPPSLQEGLGRQTLDALDHGFFEASRLPRERRAALQGLFGRVAATQSPGQAYRLELRRSPGLGPNAFALPGGVVVLTDELVALAASDREIEGVLAHEVAHGEGRHALRTALQNAGVFLLASTLLGDVASLSAVAAGLPALFVRTGYSREFEREADGAAGRYLVASAGTTKPFQALLHRLADKHGDLPAASLLSTHPGLDERLSLLRKIEGELRPSPWGRGE